MLPSHYIKLGTSVQRCRWEEVCRRGWGLLLCYDCIMTNEEKLKQLKDKSVHYEGKLAFKMKRYRGVIHESAASEMKHQEVMVLRAMVADLQKEITMLEGAS